MKFPIPDFRAEECARDLAADLRDLIREAIPKKEALDRGELNEQEINDYLMLENNIRGMADTIVVCQETEAEYRVGDFITKRTEILAARRNSLWLKAYEKIKRVLH